MWTGRQAELGTARNTAGTTPQGAGSGPRVQPRKPDPQWLKGEDTPLLHAQGEPQPGGLKTLGKPRGSPCALVSSLLKQGTDHYSPVLLSSSSSNSAMLAFYCKQQRPTQVISIDEGCCRSAVATREARVTEEPRHGRSWICGTWHRAPHRGACAESRKPIVC